MTNNDKDQMAALIEGGVVDDTPASPAAPDLLAALSRSLDAARAARQARDKPEPAGE
jgi:hypothetical protein